MSQSVVEGEGERERKRCYLHEAYLGSRLQNNGRKRVHGTFPYKRACVPLIQGLVASRRPAVNRDVTLLGRWNEPGRKGTLGVGCVYTRLIKYR